MACSYSLARTQADMIKRLHVMRQVNIPAEPGVIAVQRLGVQEVFLRDPEYCDATTDCTSTPPRQLNGDRAALLSGLNQVL